MFWHDCATQRNSSSIVLRQLIEDAPSLCCRTALVSETLLCDREEPFNRLRTATLGRTSMYHNKSSYSRIRKAVSLKDQIRIMHSHTTLDLLNEYEYTHTAEYQVYMYQEEVLYYS